MVKNTRPAPVRYRTGHILLLFADVFQYPAEQAFERIGPRDVIHALTVAARLQIAELVKPVDVPGDSAGVRFIEAASCAAENGSAAQRRRISSLSLPVKARIMAHSVSASGRT